MARYVQQRADQQQTEGAVGGVSPENLETLRARLRGGAG